VARNERAYSRVAGIIVRSTNVHAESLSVRTRVRRTRTRTMARSAHVCALSRTRERSRVCARARESLFPSVSEDRRPWPRDHERRLIRYISARALRYFILPLHIRIHGLSPYNVLM